ncbi:LAME_0G19768g1_1 [Lachancea meyersii CBS 8951]|uniref:LAME_0G19768g1_1 n=1 Tax=Lachancea meyersii CBS 8951 TaxID=1266667 RepID=A0A1G4KCB0_9SACH|nr:LAME_0G19768g1_1 [Lachancea meyersii CBS 8951]
MVFKSFKCKLYSKSYHSSAQKQSTAFFESSYQYLRRNQGLVSQDSCIPSPDNVAIAPNPVVVANVNYNNVELALDPDACEGTHSPLHISQDGVIIEQRQRRGSGSRRSSLGTATVSATVPVGQSLDRYRSRQHSESYARYPIQKSMEINGRLSKSYFSTSTAERSGTKIPDNLSSISSNPVEPHILPAEDAKHSDMPVAFSERNAIESIPPKDTRFDPTIPTWEPDTEECLNPKTFLDTQTNQIRKSFAKGDYDIINACFQSLLRNDIVPPLDVYALVMKSVCNRDLDNDNVDNRMFQLLSCYQSLINNKMKPTEEIYDVVIGSLLKGSIAAHEQGNTNGLDFYKIAVDLFQASNTNNSHQFSKELLDFSLLAMNLYPGYVKLDYVQGVLQKSKLYYKDSFYYVALTSYAKSINDNAAVKSLYEEFRNASVSDSHLQRHQYEIYSSVLSGLVETGDMALAIKLLDNVLTDAKERVGLASNVSLVLSQFLVSVSKLDCQKAYNLWYEFKKLRWVPEFSYNFYLSLLSNSLGNWRLSKKIYDYIFPMTREKQTQPSSLSGHLLSSYATETTLSSFLDYALQLKDTEVVMKLLEESVVKKFGFEPAVYPFIFGFLRDIHCPEDYLIRFINCHGDFMSRSKAKFEFLNGLIDAYQSQVILSKVANTQFFLSCCKSFHAPDSDINYSGLIACFQSLWGCPQTIEKYSYNVKLHGIMICKLYDPEGYYAVMENEFLLQFKDRLTARFEKLMTNYQRLGLDPNEITGTSVQAARMINMPEEVVEFFAHPGDWDKSYPLCLGSMIRNSFVTGSKAYERLRREGFCFDYDTYKQLVSQRVNDAETVTKCLELCPDEEEKKYMSNCLVVKTPSKELEKKVLEHPSFQEKILPYLKDDSYLRLAKNVGNIQTFMERVHFPQNFRAITEQAEHKASIGYVYEQLYRNKQYSYIVELNSLCPVLDIGLLLRACIRSGNFSQYNTLWAKYNDRLGNESCDIQAEFLLNNREVNEAIKVLRNSIAKTDHKSNDLLSFALFLKSFSTRVIHLEKVENSLQFANVLSAQDTFAGMVALYQALMNETNSNFDITVQQAVTLEITEQMLNNLEDSLQFIDLNNDQIKRTAIQKLSNYFRFRAFLKLPEVAEDDIYKVVNIYSKIQPSGIDALFNNIVETIYLNPNTRCLYLLNNMKFNFDPQQLFKLITFFEKFYASELNEEDAEKAKGFGLVLHKLYRLKD